MKLAVIGFISGFLLALLVFKWMDDSPLKAARAASEIETLRAQVTSLTPPPASVAGTEHRPLKDLAADLIRLAPRLRGSRWENWPKEAKDVQSQIMAAMNHLAQETGLTLDEAMRSPDGLALLLAEVIDPARQTQLRELLAAERPAWEQWKATRSSLSVLESRRRLLDVAAKTRESFLAALTSDQRSQVRNLGFPDRQVQGSQLWFDGTRAEVTQVLTAEWTSTLHLDEKQSQSLTPIVVEYIKNSRELNESIWARRRAGEDLSREKDYGMRADLMIQTHRRIAEALQLNTEQKEALKEWGFTYGVNLTDATGD